MPSAQHALTDAERARTDAARMHALAVATTDLQEAARLNELCG